jgi:hypothetical protein
MDTAILEPNAPQREQMPYARAQACRTTSDRERDSALFDIATHLAPLSGRFTEWPGPA